MFTLQALREKTEVMKMLNEVREAKSQLEEELFQVRVTKDTQDVLKKRLSVSEVSSHLIILIYVNICF